MEVHRKRVKMVSSELEMRLYNFIDDGKVEEAKLFVADPNCNVNFVVYDIGYTPLSRALYRGQFDIVKVLLTRRDLLINYQDLDGSTALIEGSCGGNTRCIKLLLEDPRIDANIVDRDGYSALWWAYYQSSYIGTDAMKLLISHGANIEGVAESVLKDMKGNGLGFLPSFVATEVMENWVRYLPKFTRFAKSNKYYPTEFKEWAFNFILCCLRSRSFPKDIIHLLLEYIARAWKRV